MPGSALLQYGRKARSQPVLGPSMM